MLPESTMFASFSDDGHHKALGRELTWGTDCREQAALVLWAAGGQNQDGGLLLEEQEHRGSLYQWQPADIQVRRSVVDYRDSAVNTQFKLNLLEY